MKVYERFLDYVSYPTTSKEDSDTCPSTDCQLALAHRLYDELTSLGLSDVRLDEYGYVYAVLPATEGVKAPTIGFIAHMDTSDACPGEGINPQIVIYSGGDVLLNDEEMILMRRDDHPVLDLFRGECLVTSDGTTLLGCDDKAGIAEIVTAVEELIESGVPHGKVVIGFTPDEEIGRGADRFDVAGFGADFAYTVDGGLAGELEYESFNAAAAKVKITGISMHPGSAKGKMKNAASIAAHFAALLPPDEVPEKTEGREGFFHLCSLTATVERAEMSYIIRDHSKEIFERRKAQFRAAVDELNREYGNVAECTVTDSYYNMGDVLRLPENAGVIDLAHRAMSELGLELCDIPIRGGTDGARLSYMGLPCPNLPSGGVNGHSRFEFTSIGQLNTCCEIIKRIITDAVV